MPGILRILHWVGLTNLSDEQVEQYCRHNKTKPMSASLLWILHAIGLTNLSDEQVNFYCRQKPVETEKRTRKSKWMKYQHVMSIIAAISIVISIFYFFQNKALKRENELLKSKFAFFDVKATLENRIEIPELIRKNTVHADRTKEYSYEDRVAKIRRRRDLRMRKLSKRKSKHSNGSNSKSGFNVEFNKQRSSEPKHGSNGSNSESRHDSTGFIFLVTVLFTTLIFTLAILISKYSTRK